MTCDRVISMPCCLPTVWFRICIAMIIHVGLLLGCLHPTHHLQEEHSTLPLAISHAPVWFFFTVQMCNVITSAAAFPCHVPAFLGKVSRAVMASGGLDPRSGPGYDAMQRLLYICTAERAVSCDDAVTPLHSYR
jgi:hypothetical protein